ncbi:hypothetical protein ACJ72_01984 [Emergomyces africanus]|uniref:Uncharacterized protein n=1 Tax=Emergomyces africanus TaxID=1955775 RepID=A0A1B7P3R5_9EURO|nr:hypothetical protein ACJ72_01984 [Emergomyces africanus]
MLLRQILSWVRCVMCDELKRDLQGSRSSCAPPHSTHKNWRTADLSHHLRVCYLVIFLASPDISESQRTGLSQLVSPKKDNPINPFAGDSNFKDEKLSDDTGELRVEKGLTEQVLAKMFPDRGSDRTEYFGHRIDLKHAILESAPKAGGTVQRGTSFSVMAFTAIDKRSEIRPKKFSLASHTPHSFVHKLYGPLGVSQGCSLCDDDQGKGGEILFLARHSLFNGGILAKS